MALPIRTTIDDIEKICRYLATKPTGATIKEAKTVLDAKHLDARKLNALRFWDLITGDEDKIVATSTGRELAKGSTWREKVLLAVIRNTPPYRAIVERAVHRGEETVSTTDVGAHWHEHFSEDASESDEILKDQAVCFFNVALGAELGVLVPGRRGAQTRFDFDPAKASAFVGASSQARGPTTTTTAAPPAIPRLGAARAAPTGLEDQTREPELRTHKVSISSEDLKLTVID